MTAALRDFTGVSRPRWLAFICLLGALFLPTVLSGSRRTSGHSVQSPRAKLEEMVMGSPITTSTTLIDDQDLTEEGEPQAVSGLSPSDRFRKIIETEAAEAEVEQEEPMGVLHPVQKPRKIAKSPAKGVAAKLAAGAAPTALLFSQVVYGSKLKESVLKDDEEPFAEDMPDGTSFRKVPLAYEATPFASETDSLAHESRFNSAVTSPTAVGAMAAVAALTSLYFGAKAWNQWRKRRAVGLLGPRTAKWDLDRCILIIDVHGAEDAGTIRGTFVPASAGIKVSLNTQRAILTYLRLPSITESPWKRLRRRPEIVEEQFDLPSNHCFVRALRSRKGKSKTSSHGTIREYVESGRFGGERVAALVVHAEKSPGLQLLERSAVAAGPPPVDLIDTILLKHESTGENSVGLELPPTTTAKDVAEGGLESLIFHDNACGGAVLCVDSFSISSSKNLCTVHAAVEDSRSISVQADVALQILLITGKSDDNGSHESPQAEFMISLPPHCVLADASDAFYSVTPFKVDFEASPHSEDNQASGDAIGDSMKADDTGISTNLDTQRAGGGSTEAGEENLDTANTSTPLTDDVNADHKSGKSGEDGGGTGTAKHGEYQHVRIQFKAAPRPERTVILSALPKRRLPRETK